MACDARGIVTRLQSGLRFPGIPGATPAQRPPSDEGGERVDVGDLSWADKVPRRLSRVRALHIGRADLWAGARSAAVVRQDQSGSGQPGAPPSPSRCAPDTFSQSKKIQQATPRPPQAPRADFTLQQQQQQHVRAGAVDGRRPKTPVLPEME
jgi:hypothetical protein